MAILCLILPAKHTKAEWNLEIPFVKISWWDSFSVTKSLYCAFQLNCYTVWPQEGVRERWTKKKRTRQFQAFVIQTTFFSTSCRKHSAGVYLDANQWTAWTISGLTLPQHSADSFKCLMMPLSDLETSSLFEKASSASVSSVPPRFWLHKTIVREQSTGSSMDRVLMFLDLSQ